ncbi:beta strand repeat-containing protein [Halobaculum gomorrense]|uniref:Uncharacterized protein n=1 Tax=Halobaculum gomorrense TaxID=43928 RepID=A0A1M5MMW5_9EURY|nr:hypothetical protein [Halobaculum gomorrense]SHG78576.1 hypothetical protein SAMN05443636_1069 [Halobaculum gomorrense]
MNRDDVPLDEGQVKIVGLIAALVVSAALGPMLFMPSPDAPDRAANASSGTVVTPTPAPADTGDSGGLEELSTGRSPPDDLSRLGNVPKSHTQAGEQVPTPPVAASAGAQTLRVEATVVDGEPALNLTDTRNHDGRWVSVPTAWFEQVYGTVPEVARIANSESGAVYTEPVTIRGGQAVFWTRGYSTNTVTFGGELLISDDPAVDGTTHTYDITNLASASEPTGTLTGVVNTETESHSGTGLATNDVLGLSVAGNLAPSNAEVTFEGRATTFGEVREGYDVASGSTTSVSVAGDTAPVNATVTFYGSGSSSSNTISATTVGDGHQQSFDVEGSLSPSGESVVFRGVTQTGSTYTPSGTGDGSITVNGNVAPYGPASGSEPSIQFTGRETTTARTVSVTSVSDGSTTSFTIDGNLAPTGESVTFSGETTTSSGDQSWSGVGDGQILSVSNPGNIEPTGPVSSEPEVVVTAPQNRQPLYDLGDGTTEADGFVFYTGYTEDSQHTFDVSTTETLYSFTVPGVDSLSSSCSATVWVNTGDLADSTPMEGTKQGTWNVGTNPTYVFPSPIDVSSVSTVTIELGESTCSYRGAQDDSASSAYFATTGTKVNSYSNAIINPSPSSVIVTADTGQTADFGAVSAGTSESEGIDLSASTLSLTVQTSTGVDIVLTKTDRTATEDPSIDVDGDGTAEASVSGILTEGQTVTDSSVDVSTGSHTATTTTNTGSIVSWDFSFDERTATQNPAVDVTGDGTTDASYSGILTGGESVTVPLSALSSGSTTLDTSTAVGPQPSWTVTYDARIATEDPSLALDGTTIASHSGILADGETVTLTNFDVSTGSHTLTLSTAGGSVTSYDLSLTNNSGSKNPQIDIGGDGSTDAIYDGTLQSGETATVSLPGLSVGSNTLVFGGSGSAYDYRIEFERVEHAETPSIDVTGDGTPDAQYNGTLAPGESATVSLANLSTSSSAAVVSVADGGRVDATLTFTERTGSAGAGLTLNDATNTTSGVLTAAETRTVTFNVSSALVEGTNSLTVELADEALSADAPQMSVDVEYGHEMTERKSVSYQAEGLSERYNVSFTTSAYRNETTLTIDHAETVVSMRSLDYRINESGGWAAVPDGNYTLTGTELTIDADALTPTSGVPEDTTIEIRSVASKVRAHNAEITVTRTTDIGSDLNSRVRFDTWGSSSWLGVSNTSEGQLLHYAVNESYSDESEYAEIDGGGAQRLYFPYASTGSEVTLRTLPVALGVDHNTVEVTVPESIANASSPLFYLRPGSVTGDPVTVEYVGADSGVWYGVFDESESARLDRAEGGATMTIPRDDVGLVAVRESVAPAKDTSGVGGGIFAAVRGGNLLSLLVLFGGVAGLVIAGRAPSRARASVDGLAGALGGLVGRIPRVGDTLGDLVERGVETAGNAYVSVGSNNLLTAAVGGAVLVSALQVGLIDLGAETAAMLGLAGIAVATLVLLRQFDAFSPGRWIGIVAVSAVIALQGLGEGDLLTALVNSDAFILVVLILGYAVYSLVQEYRANNNPNDDRPQIVIDAGGDNQ